MRVMPSAMRLPPETMPKAMSAGIVLRRPFEDQEEDRDGRRVAEPLVRFQMQDGSL